MELSDASRFDMANTLMPNYQFTVPNEQDYTAEFKRKEQAQGELVTLLTRLNQGMVSYDSFEFKLAVINLAKSWFGSFDIFLKHNYNNAELTQHEYLLLGDCVEFIKTGVRPVSLFVRLGLIDADRQTGKTTYPTESRIDYSKDLFNDGYQAYAHWVRQHGGFVDLLDTLKAVVGASTRSL